MAGTQATIPGLGPKITVEGGVATYPTSQTGRISRRPSHPFYLQYAPYSITPFCIAPVLPGDTMKNALIQARCVTDPIKNPLIGWWNEYYLFYVKLTDLDEFVPDYSDMLLKNIPPTTSCTRGGAALIDWYEPGGESFTFACLCAVNDAYFRDEEEVALGKSITRLGTPSGAGDPDRGWFAAGFIPKAKVTMSNAFQSLVLDTDTPAAETEELPGMGYPTLPSHLTPFADAYAQWQEMIAMKMTEVTFDDYLKQFGVSVPPEVKEQAHIPELIRYVRDFQYPSNTVNPADGTVASAVSWSIAERADKDRYFAEPGFIFGVTTSRPKVYLGQQRGSVASFMNDAYAWLPALLLNDPYTSLKKFDDAVAGPVNGMVQDYWLDIRDLFLYGDQFCNVAVTSANMNVVTLPANQAGVSGMPLNDAYASDSDIYALFKSTVAGTATWCRVDGRVDFTILSRLVDTTP